MATVREVVASYRLFLEVKYPSHLGRFDARRGGDSEGADAEAVVFALLRDRGFDVTIAEDVSAGGVDFHCKSADHEFLAEVTCLTVASLTNHSGLADEIPTTGGGGSFSRPTHLLRTKLSSKASQLSGSFLPRLLVIVGFHSLGSVLMGRPTAEAMLTSDCSIAVSIPDGAASSITDLKDSGFIRRSEGGTIEACRRSISAVLLLQANGDCCDAYGVLHPDPVVPFPVAAFPRAPFVRLQEWPPHDMKLELEWVIDDPQPWRTYYDSVGFRDDELKKL